MKTNEEGGLQAALFICLVLQGTVRLTSIWFVNGKIGVGELLLWSPRKEQRRLNPGRFVERQAF